jgi:hypothetical protein
MPSLPVVGGFTAARRAIAAEICGNDVRKRDARMSLAERNDRWQGRGRARSASSVQYELRQAARLLFACA